MFSTIAIFYNVTIVSYRNVGQLGRGNYLAVFSVPFPGLFRIINAASKLGDQSQIPIRLFSIVRFFLLKLSFPVVLARPMQYQTLQPSYRSYVQMVPGPLAIEAPNTPDIILPVMLKVRILHM